MTTFTTTQTLPFGAITVHRVIAAFETIRETVADYAARRRTVTALRALSPDQLVDIGLTLGDVEDIANGRL